eukprot:c21628_g1_i1.p1 GENE.c21628_g1_i1~~c21628_g1_i1.p1  ORF type:complete len:520 (+),score=96.13 c21628_g1_i1:41-1600(+)
MSHFLSVQEDVLLDKIASHTTSHTTLAEVIKLLRGPLRESAAPFFSHDFPGGVDPADVQVTDAAATPKSPTERSRKRSKRSDRSQQTSRPSRTATSPKKSTPNPPPEALISPPPKTLPQKYIPGPPPPVSEPEVPDPPISTSSKKRRSVEKPKSKKRGHSRQQPNDEKEELVQIEQPVDVEESLPKRPKTNKRSTPKSKSSHPREIPKDTLEDNRINTPEPSQSSTSTYSRTRSKRPTRSQEEGVRPEQPSQTTVDVAEEGNEIQQSEASLPQSTMIVLCRRLMQQLRRRPESVYFHEAVDTNQVCDYAEIIKSPMDMLMIHAKLQAKHYQTFAEFSADVHLMFKNCIRYAKYGKFFREDYDHLAEDAQVMLDAFEAEVAKLKAKGKLGGGHKEEEEWPVDSLVMAKMPGYPRWPGLIADPSELKGQKQKKASKSILVYFFAEKLVGWVHASTVRSMTQEDIDDGVPGALKDDKTRYSQAKLDALAQAFVEASGAWAEADNKDVDDAPTHEDKSRKKRK